MEKSQNRVGRLISAGSTDSDILYGSGFNAHDEFLYYEADGKQHIAVSVLELSRAMDEAHPHVIVQDRNDIIRKTGKRDILLGLPEFTGINEWIVPDSFPVAYADRMRSSNRYRSGTRMGCDYHRRCRVCQSLWRTRYIL